MGDVKALEAALRVESVDEHGYHIGAHVIPRGPHGNAEMYYRKFQEDQLALGGTPKQLEVLADMRAGKLETHAASKDAETRAVLAAVPDRTYGTLAGRSDELRAGAVHQPLGPVDKDQTTVIVNGAERTRGGVSTSGSVSGVDKHDGVTTIQYAVGGRLQTLSFKDPMGHEGLHDVRHPLNALGELGPGDKFKLQIDASGKNAAFTVVTDNDLRYDGRTGPQATKIYGEPPKQIEPKRGSPELEAAIAVDTVDESGYHIGAHVIPRGPYKHSEEYLKQFQADQRAIGGTPKQLEVLANVRAGAPATDAQMKDPEVRKVLEGVPDRLYATIAAKHDAFATERGKPHDEHAVDPNLATVSVNGIEKARGGVSLSGKVSGIAHGEGITAVQYDVGGRLQTLTFRDPIGKDGAGNDVKHPLHELGTLEEGDRFKLKIDGSGKNVAYAVETSENVRYEQRHGPQATQIFGRPEQQEAVHHAR